MIQRTRTALLLTAALTTALGLALPAALAQTAPMTKPAASAPAMTDTLPKPMSTTRMGAFKTLYAPTQGNVRLAKNAQGRWTLTVTGLKTEPAPDLHVWLVPQSPVKDTPTLAQGKRLDLGTIQTTTTSRTYVLPANMKPDGYRSVVLWCEQFSVAFAAATLQ
jgi:hypothetical protein